NVTFIAGALCLTLSGVSLGSEGFQLAIALFILFYILQSLRKPLSVGYLSEHIATKIMATGLSGESQLRSLFSAVFAFLMGLLVQYTGLSTAIISISLLTLLLYPIIRLTEED
ncbi:MAG: hypothetical protein GY757_02865, partial [bacterium]|nr:hypothetical protein [bacterium]